MQEWRIKLGIGKITFHKQLPPCRQSKERLKEWVRGVSKRISADSEVVIIESDESIRAEVVLVFTVNETVEAYERRRLARRRTRFVLRRTGLRAFYCKLKRFK